MQRPADVHTTFATEVTSRCLEKSTAGMVQVVVEAGLETAEFGFDPLLGID